jgi:putative flippase GtrA
MLRVWQIRQVRFVAMGIVNTASNLATFAIVHLLTDGNADWFAVLCSHTVGISVAFVTQRTVVFEVASDHPRMAQLRRFLTVYGSGILLNLALLALFKSLGLPPIVAQAVALLLIAGSTYVVHSRWTFHHPEVERP